MSEKVWAVNGIVKGGKFLGYFKAETKEQAIELALNSDASNVSLCHECSGECEDGAIEEADAWLK